MESTKRKKLYLYESQLYFFTPNSENHKPIKSFKTTKKTQFFETCLIFAQLIH